MFPRYIAATLLFGVLVAATSALAQDQRQEFCDQYAALAAEQYNAAAGQGCNVPASSSLWSGERNEHFTYCTHTDELDVMAAMRERHDHMQANCPDLAANYRCAVYSLETMAYVLANRDLACGYNESEPRWTPGFRPHFDWCDGFRPAQWDLDARTQTRQELIDQCVAGQGSVPPESADDQDQWPGADEQAAVPEDDPGDTDFPTPSSGGGQGGGSAAEICDAYANQSVRDGELNEQMMCGHTEGRWNTDYHYHYEYCMALTPDELAEIPAEIIADRHNILNVCRHSWVEPVTNTEFVWVPGDCFAMGCGFWSGECDQDETPQHSVCVDGFWMGQTEVTQRHWQLVMGEAPSHGPNYPMTSVSWDDIQVFIQTLRRMSGDQYEFRLPTEAEWEFACRQGGKALTFSGNSDLPDRVAWHEGNTDRLNPVRTRLSNYLELNDMSGGVWEFVNDQYLQYPSGQSTNPHNPISSSSNDLIVIRGGSWGDPVAEARCSNREYAAEEESEYIGFRLVRED